MTRSTDEVSRILSEISEPRKWNDAFNFGRSKPFHGSVEGSSFKLYRAIKYRNSFLPILEGKIESRGTDTVVSVNLRMNYYATFFVCIWLFVTLAMALGELSEFEMPYSLVPWVMFVFGYLMMQGGFWYEVPKAKRLLNETLANGS